MKTAIQLEVRDGHEGERTFVLLEDDGSIVAAAGPDVSCTIDAGRCKSALAEIGFDEGEFVVGPVIEVSPATMGVYLRGWGPDSRLGILRRARRFCQDQNIVLSTEATTERFEKAGDREFAAALWFLWIEGECTGATTSAPSDGGFRRNEACQIGAFVLYWDEDGRLSFDEFPSAAAAAQRVSEIAGRRPGSSPPGFEHLAAADAPPPGEKS